MVSFLIKLSDKMIITNNKKGAYYSTINMSCKVLITGDPIEHGIFGEVSQIFEDLKPYFLKRIGPALDL